MNKFVLIGGLPRSGTTLVETIIGSHSQISIPPGDFPFVDFYVRGKSVKQIFEDIANRKVTKLWHAQNFSDFYSYAHNLAFINFLEHYAKSINKKIAGTKAPYSEFYFNVIQDWLSDYDIKFVHVIRNPIDNMASLKHSHLHKNKDQKRIDTLRTNCTNWCRSASMALARSHFNYEHYYLVKYEDLVNYPSEECKKLCQFLGVEFEEERMLNRKDYSYHNTNTSFPDEVKKNKSDDYIYRSTSRRHYLTASEIRVAESCCGEIGSLMGYEDIKFQIRPHERPRAANLGERIIRKAYGEIKKIVQRA